MTNGPTNGETPAAGRHGAPPPPGRAPGGRRPPPFGAEHDQLRAAIRAFVERELKPNAHAWEEARWFPDDVFTKLAAAGYLGLKYPVEYCGAGGGFLHDAVLAEELARCGSGGVAAGVGAHTSIATPPVWRFGTEEQKTRYLAPSIRGEKIAALAITEPDAGSDVAALRTRAERVDGGWLVNGSKTYITNGVRAHYYVTAVRTHPEGGHQGISFLIVDRGEGVRASQLSKLGWHASDTAELAFEDVFVPEQNLLGELHRGFYLIMANFQWERLLMALGAVGSMRAGLERYLAGERPRGQAARHLVSELATRMEAAAALTYDALRRFDGGENPVREVTMAKLLSQRASFELHDTCFRLTADPEFDRAARDARLGPIGGGTDEIMKEILGRTLGL